jgi:acetylornithine/succinyldiaminopimelate/putrescine aminotransferase
MPAGAPRRRGRGSPANALARAFRRHVAQTSTTPLGLTIASARGSWVTDTSGRRYLDLVAGMGVVNIGHGHPAVHRACREQLRRYLHVMVYGEYVLEPQVRLARRLVELAGPPFETVYFTNSGAEAIEGALKTARKHTGRSRFVAFDLGFHGDTFGALSVGGNPRYRVPFLPLLPEVTIAPWNDRGALRRIDRRVAAVVIEPIQAEGGVRIPDADFVRALRARCSEVGALLVFDEVVTGLGRTGSLFAFQRSGVRPDLLVLAKALGGGLPLGAFLGTRRVLATLAHDPPLAHVTTFGGHPLACATALAALDVTLRRDLPARATRMGATFRRGLERLQRTHPAVRAVRAVGLLLAVELATAAITRRFAAACVARGLILNWTLHRDTVIRLAPPLTISRAEIAYALGVMDAALRDATARKPSRSARAVTRRSSAADTLR